MQVSSTDTLTPVEMPPLGDRHALLRAFKALREGTDSELSLPCFCKHALSMCEEHGLIPNEDLLFFLITSLFPDLPPVDSQHWSIQLAADYKLLMSDVMSNMASTAINSSGSVNLGDSDTHSTVVDETDSHPSFIDDENATPSVVDLTAPSPTEDEMVCSHSKHILAVIIIPRQRSINNTGMLSQIIKNKINAG